jgi:hypothetical protein
MNLIHYRSTIDARIISMNKDMCSVQENIDNYFFGGMKRG